MSEEKHEHSTIVIAVLCPLCMILAMFFIGRDVYMDARGGRVDAVDNYLTEEYLEELSGRKIISIKNFRERNSFIGIKRGKDVNRIDLIPAIKIDLPYGILVVEDYQIKYQDRTRSCGDVMEPEYECVKENAEKFIKLSLLSLNKTMKDYQELEKGE